MAESRRERKKEETRKKLIEAAADLFRRQGFANTAVDQITEAADVGKGTFYNYFDTKEAVVTAYIDEVTEDYMQIMPMVLQLPDTGTRLKAVMKESAGWAEANPEFIRIDVAYRTNRNLGHPEFLETDGLWKMICQILEFGQQAGDIRDDQEVMELATYFYGLLCGVLIAWFDWPDGLSLAERFERMIEFFINGAKSY
jgi:AcrR family transcriptional regulator